jgi:hypothetical protein
MSKTIIIVEGSNDLKFICKLLSCCTQNNIKLYDNGGNKNQKKDNETNILRNFIQPKSPHNIIIKAEQGKNNVFSLVNNIINFVFEHYDLKLYIIFDHDNKNPGDDIHNFIEKIKANKMINSNSFDIKFKNTGFIIQDDLFKWDIYISAGKTKRTMIVYTFKKSLERTLKFDKNKPETLDEKIIEFIDKHNTELESLFE